MWCVVRWSIDTCDLSSSLSTATQPPNTHPQTQPIQVTGSAHCCLAAYWAKELGKTSLLAYQASKRGGALRVVLDEARGRVRLGGKAVLVKHGVLGC